jgi:hypothetical protein
MSEQEQVLEQTQNAQEESVATPQEQQQPEVDTSKIFSKGYNEGKSKAEKDVLAKFSSLGIENAQSLDDVINHFSQAMNPKKEDQSEVEQLRKMLEVANAKAEEAYNNYEVFRQETLLENQLTEAMNSVKAEGSLSIKDDHLKNLFYMEYEVEEQDGSFYASRNGIPMLDQEGNRKSLTTVLRDFVRENNYSRPVATGTGGSSGNGIGSDKPSRSEFNKLIQSKSADAQRRAAELYSQYKQVGSWGA